MKHLPFIKIPPPLFCICFSVQSREGTGYLPHSDEGDSKKTGVIMDTCHSCKAVKITKFKMYVDSVKFAFFSVIKIWY